MNFKELLEKESIFSIVSESAEELGLDTYVVGGYVRDLLLKRPSKDIDFVCVGNGIDLAKHVGKKLGKDEEHIAIFKNFGTAMLRYQSAEIEFVGARKESYSQHSRKPKVIAGSIEDDQLRRDFTINALAISVNKSDFGELSDPFNGVKDLKRKIVRTPLDPHVTFSDDPLRMLRAVRFASQLGFDISPETFEALNENKERLSIVSMERISTELNKIILSKTPSYGFKLLFHSGLLEMFFPEMVALHGVETINKKSHKDNFYHTLQVLDNVAQVSDDLWLRWAAILHDIAKPATKRFDPKVGWTFHGHEEKGARMVPHIFRRLKLPMNEKMKSVAKLVKLHLRPIALVKEDITDSAIRRLLYEAGEGLPDLMKLCRADITSKNDQKVKRYLENFNRVERKLEEVEAKDQLRNFQPVITGEVIMETFDLKPGKVVGDIKTDIREAVLEGEVSNEYGQAYAYMLKLAKEKYGLEKAKDKSR
ncbi:HD domain-containing protein [Cytophagaceae bacterium ABcell3]|nr:HD domain-containing protein [Cytophagaceae bacterium ABcell3]